MPTLLSSVLTLLLVGCAGLSRKAHQEYLQHLREGRWQQALTQTQGPKFYSKEHSRLVKSLEQGLLHHLQGEYYQAQQALDQAKAHADRLFTVSLSRKALQLAGSDSLDHYYGEVYELSALRFYSALNHYLLSQQGFYEAHPQGSTLQQHRDLSPTERRRHREAARAVVVEWNAKIREWQGERAGNTVFKDDLLAKVFGAWIHQQAGGRTERQTARLLYRDAQRVLRQNYNAYPSFNLLGKKFKRDFDQLPTLPPQQVTEQYIQATPQAQALAQYLKQQSQAKGAAPNLTVLVHHGLISPKRPKTYRFPLDIASHIKTIVTGQMTPIDFAIQILGLVSNGGIPAIEFELPEVAPQPVTSRFFLQIARDSKVVKEHPLQLVSPLSDIAREAVQEHALATRLRLGARLASKHIAAIISAYATYRGAIQSGTPDLAAQFLATGIYLGASKGIAYSEQADLRAWMSLPHTINLTSLNLQPGTYQFTLRQEKGGSAKTHPLSPLTLKPGDSYLLSTRVL